MQYRIYEEFFNDVEKKLKRIEKKCAKHGNPFKFEIIGSEIEERIDKKTKEKIYYKFIIVEVEGTAKINDYECVAVLENHDSGNVIRRINTDIEIPDRFMHTKNVCEHCNSNRQRKELYIIHNVVTDEFKQVGSSCLMLYTNGLNAEYVTSYINGITELEEYDGFVGSGGKYYIPVDEVLCYATEIINKMGYFNSNSNLPTKHLVIEMLSKYDDLSKKLSRVNEDLYIHDFEVRFYPNDFNKKDTDNVVKEIIEYYLSLNPDNEFINNVQVILKDRYVEYHNVGFLCYLPSGYYKYIESEKKRAERSVIDGKSEYFGIIGKRYKEESVDKIEIVNSYSTMYGTVYIYKILLKSGNILIWKSTNWFEDKELRSVDEITFTVKSHEEYRNVKQTDVTRCKLIMKKNMEEN